MLIILNIIYRVQNLKILRKANMVCLYIFKSSQNIVLLFCFYSACKLYFYANNNFTASCLNWSTTHASAWIQHGFTSCSSARWLRVLLESKAMPAFMIWMNNQLIKPVQRLLSKIVDYGLTSVKQNSYFLIV